MVFDKTGALANVKRHDCLPFGEELTNQGLRSTYPHLPYLLMEDLKGAWDVAASDVLAHEMGEVAAEWGLIVGDSNHISVAFENEARRIRDPNAKLRTGHSAPNDARSDNWKLVIQIP